MLVILSKVSGARGRVKDAKASRPSFFSEPSSSVSLPRRLGPFGPEGRERSPRTLPARAGGMQAPPVVSAVWAFSAHVGRGHILTGLCVLTPATGQE